MINLLQIQMVQFFWTNLMLLAFICMGLCFIAISVWKNKTFIKRFHLNYEAIQKLHVDPTPRLGGLVIFLSLIFFCLITNNIEIKTFLTMFLTAMAAVALITVAEDLKQTVPFSVRLASQFITASLLVLWMPSHLPIIDIPLISQLFEVEAFRVGFFILCLVGLMNGMNFIDGANGLMPMVTIAGLVNLLFLSILSSDSYYISLILVNLIPMTTSLFFNYPFGKIFAGDFGAYLYGSILGFLTINFFAVHPEFSSWTALLIVFYPSLELVYSFFRKIIQGKSPFEPDRSHLHIKVFDLLLKGGAKHSLANNLIVIFISIFWLAPMFIIPWVYTSTSLILLSLIILTFIYIALNIVIPSVFKPQATLEKNNNLV